MSAATRKTLLTCAALAVLVVAGVLTWRDRRRRRFARTDAQGFALRELATGLSAPVLATHAGDGSGRVFVVEQPGWIVVVDGGALRDAPFLDLSAQVAFGGEKGLLGLAFHPRFASNGRFFVDYTVLIDGKLHTRVSEWRVSAEDPSRADPASERELLRVEQPYGNHNGGHLAFGPDGHLYVGFGDGGSAFDPQGNGQNPQTLLGTIARLDVDAETRPYGIPADNPFAAGLGGRPEVYAWGLRNPWRFSFGPRGRLFVADVGQNRYEELHLVNRGDNCGWKRMEGLHGLEQEQVDTDGLALPIAEYGRDEGASITGGHVYQGQALPELRGAYVFADYYPGNVWTLREVNGTWTRAVLGAHDFHLSSFGLDEAGELLLVDHQGGRVLAMVAP